MFRVILANAGIQVNSDFSDWIPAFATSIFLLKNLLATPHAVAFRSCSRGPSRLHGMTNMMSLIGNGKNEKTPHLRGVVLQRWRCHANISFVRPETRGRVVIKFESYKVESWAQDSEFHFINLITLQTFNFH